MSVPPNAFDDYLAPDEPVIDGTAGTLIEGSARSEGAIGITDRRVLVVGEGDRFLDVSHEAVSSIRGSPGRTITRRGIGYPVAALAGIAVAAASALLVATMAGGAVGYGLASLAFGGVAVAEYARRVDIEVVWRSGGTGPGASGLAELLQAPTGAGRPALVVGEGGDTLVVGLGFLSVFALVGLVVASGSLLVVPLALLAVVGMGLADAARRRARALHEVDGRWRRQRVVTLHLVDGRTVSLRVDAGERLDTELSGVVREVTPSDRPLELTGSG